MSRITMNKDRFWAIIDEARQSTVNWKSMFEPLMDRLSVLDEKDIIKWGHIFDEYHVLADKEQISAAAYIILNGCNDDSFIYFRSWLIAQGKRVYHKALADPESLANLKSVKIFAHEVSACEYTPMSGYVYAARFEEMLSAAQIAHERSQHKSSEYNAMRKKFRLSKKEKASIANNIIYAKNIDVQWVGTRDFIEIEEDKPRITVDKLLPKLYNAFNGGDIS